MKVKLLTGAILAALIGGVLPAPAPGSDRASIYETLAGRDELAVLFVAVTEARETATLRTGGPYTLFAPSDAAFQHLGAAAIKKLATDKDAVRALLRAHLVEGKLTAKDLTAPDAKEPRSLDGGALRLDKRNDALRVCGAKVVVADIACSNGVIHIVDTVLPPAKK